MGQQLVEVDHPLNQFKSEAINKEDEMFQEDDQHTLIIHFYCKGVGVWGCGGGGERLGRLSKSHGKLRLWGKNLFEKVKLNTGIFKLHEDLKPQRYAVTLPMNSRFLALRSFLLACQSNK